MKVKATQVQQAYTVLGRLVSEKRPLSTKGKYRIARLFTLLTKEAEVLDAQRRELIMRYGVEVFKSENGTQVSTGNWQVPPEKVEAYQAEWAPIAEAVIDVACEPIPLSQLEAPPLVEVSEGGTKRMIDPLNLEELVLLGEFISDDTI